MRPLAGRQLEDSCTLFRSEGRIELFDVLTKQGADSGQVNAKFTWPPKDEVRHLQIAHLRSYFSCETLRQGSKGQLGKTMASCAASQSYSYCTMGTAPVRLLTWTITLHFSWTRSTGDPDQTSEDMKRTTNSL
jgi:hypothetical protein